MQSFLEFSEEKKIVVKTKMGGEIPATIKVTGKDYHIVKTDSGKTYKVDHQGNSLEEEIELSEEQLNEINVKQIKKDLDAGLSHDAVIGKHANKKLTNTNEIRKVIQQHAWNKRMKKEETDDKDLPFTPDKKPTKPSTPGKYGDAYSTVRNLARRALEKQAKKQVKESEELDEKSDQARANKARKNVMDAGRGAAYRRRTGVNLDPKTDGYPSQQALNKALGRFLRREETELDEANYGDDEHFSKQSPKMQDAINRHLRSGKSYKDAVAAAQKHVKEEIEEGYRGNSEADKPFFAAQDHKKAAEKARKSGDHFSYHKHMSAHHGAMNQWNSNKGRTHVANQHAMKADEHENYAQQARKGSK